MENAIKKDRITTDETLRETASHGSEEYPFSYYYEDIWDFDFHCVFQAMKQAHFSGTGTQRSNLFMYSMARLIFWWVETGMF